MAGKDISPKAIFPATIARDEWYFADVPENEVVACAYWEYARESAWLRDLKLRCASPEGQLLADPSTM